MGKEVTGQGDGAGVQAIRGGHVEARQVGARNAGQADGGAATARAAALGGGLLALTLALEHL